MAGTYSPQSGVDSVHINRELTQLSIAYKPSAAKLIADQLFPVIKVNNRSDLYYFWNKGQRFNLLRSDGYGSLKGDRAAAKRMSFGATKKNYQASEFALATDVSDEELSNADQGLTLLPSKIAGVQDLVLLDYEVRVATIATTAANYATSNKLVISNGSGQWNNASFASVPTSGVSTIKQQIMTGVAAVMKSTGGLMPNTIVIPYQVAMVMASDKGLNSVVQYTVNTIANGNIFGDELFGMKPIIPSGHFQSIVEGEADNISQVWGNNVIIAYVNPNPSLNSLTFGATFRKRDWQVRQWREEQVPQTVYEAGFVQDEKLIAADCAYLISNCCA